MLFLHVVEFYVQKLTEKGSYLHGSMWKHILTTVAPSYTGKIRASFYYCHRIIITT